MTVYMIYTRHGKLKAERTESVDYGQELMEALSDDGQIYAIGLFDTELNTAHIPQITALQTDQDEHLARIKEAMNLANDYQFTVVRQYC